MRMAAMVGAVGFALAGAIGVAFACGDKTVEASYKTVTVQGLAELLKRPEKTQLVDVNNAEVRASYGVIPGAYLLSNPEKYAFTELPQTRATTLVFYCGGPMCQAAPKAATRAVQAGYTNVSVLEVGIKGWRDAGMPVNKPQT